MKKSNLFSIIVPIYNVENYISDCMDSIRMQCQDRTEVILVDDGSTDGSGPLAQAYCNENKNFRYFRKQNGGLSDARNFGLRQSTGDYVVFVDSDDLIAPDLISSVEKLIDAESPDLVFLHHVKFYSEGKAHAEIFDADRSKSYSVISRTALARKENFSWARIARREMYDPDPFPVGLIYEDVATSPLLTARAGKIVEVPRALYAYRKRKGSITTAAVERQFDSLAALEILKQRFEKYGLSMQVYYATVVNNCRSLFINLARMNEPSAYSEKFDIVHKYYSGIRIRDILRSLSAPGHKLLALAARNKYMLSFAVWFIKSVLRFRQSI